MERNYGDVSRRFNTTEAKSVHVCKVQTLSMDTMDSIMKIFKNN